MTLVREKDDDDVDPTDKNLNEAGERLTGGDLTDDISINDPNKPIKTPKNQQQPPQPEKEYDQEH